ncbi:FMN-dependent NADH-azoreductase [Verrucomicrobium sp. GAS474]|uniref:FMN-dependent NADH-azoreductase n=1 Tax=Verrucomicrobium sp. GAS474 TaxID=1882831 RepID=UPI00087BF58D|nr:FMN-dependent NADH-azoreductase [Verrucomicrobium sp. GAS474]SDT90143.1 FMN-dependent NADH-azoreductase [Verrucomicrobium sp. GAS474]
MSTLLHIDASPRGERSITRSLTHDFVAAWKAAHPGEKVISRDLGHQPPPFVDEAWIAAAFAPEPTAADTAALAFSSELIAEIHAADRYVFGIPMYNLSIPAVFKAWIDQIVRVGRTFGFGANGLEGLVKGKKVTIITASGSVFRAGTPYAAYNFQEPYLRGILGFIGITDVEFIVADGVNDVNYGKIDRTAYLAPIREQVAAAAKA